MRDIPITELSDAWRRALEAAVAVRERAYAPYSLFHVGAALLTPEGKIIAGANVENAAYGSTICAERAALVSAIAQGERTFDAIALTARHRDFDLEDPVSPCGACRQMIFEFRRLGGRDLHVIMAATHPSIVRVATIDELLPAGFGPELGPT